MPEAVVVATARSPIGRAMKGSLKDLRPDDLTATIIRAALDKVPQLDPKDINLSPAFVDFVKSNPDRFGGKSEADILGEVRTHYAISPE